MLPYEIKRIAIWLQRMKYAQGFGIQSPSAFSFDRKVINDHNKYEAYTRLLASGKVTSRLEHKKARLLFRLSRFAQAHSFVFFPSVIPNYESYIKAACPKTRVVSVAIEDKPEPIKDKLEPIEDKSEPMVYYLSLADNYQQWYETLRMVINEQSFLIVDDINKNPVTKTFWQRIVADERVSFSYDLYYLGIAFFDKRPKQNYIINF